MPAGADGTRNRRWARITGRIYPPANRFWELIYLSVCLLVYKLNTNPEKKFQRAMTTCQISYLPIGARNTNEEVNQAIDIISRFDLETEVSDMSTTVKGEFSEIINMIDNLYREMENEHKEFRLDIDLLSSKAYS